MPGVVHGAAGHLAGIAAFTVGSALAGLIPHPVWLLLGRFVQGVGAAIALPGSVSLIAQALPEPAARARVIAAQTTTIGVASLIGPSLGGLLVSTIGWPSIFWINLPIGLATFVVAARCVTESADPTHAALDPAGQLLAVAWLGSLCVGLVDAGQYGWSGVAAAAPLAVGAGCLIAFVVVERRSPAALLPIELFADMRFVAPVVVSLVVGFSTFSVTALIPTYLQLAQDRSPTVSALMMLPAPVTGILVPRWAGRWAARSGPRAPMAVGLVATTAAMAVLSFERPDSGWGLSVAAVLLLGTAAALILAPGNLAVLAAVDRRRSGIASGIASAARQTGTTLGVAVLGSLLAGVLVDQRDARSAGGGVSLSLVCAVAAAPAVAGLLLLVLGARRSLR